MAKIGIVVYSLGGGGAERMAINLGNAFSKFSHSVTFLLANCAGEYLDLVGDNVKILHAKKEGAGNWRDLVSGYIEKEQPDVLLGMLEGASIIAIQAAQSIRSNVPVVARIPNHFSTHCKRSPNLKERFLLPLAAKWYLRKCKSVIAISNGVREDIIRSASLNPDKVVTIYNPAKIKIEESVNSVDLHPWLARSRDWLTVVTAGRLTEQKRHDVLLKAIAHANIIKDTRLLVLGQGELLDPLVQLSDSLGISEKIDFLGFRKDVQSYMAAADVFALSSDWEGFGNVIVEALSSGTRVVSTNCESGPAEILVNGQFGQLVPVGADRQLGDAILNCYDYPVDNTSLFKHLDQYEPEFVAKRYLEVMGLSGL